MTVIMEKEERILYCQYIKDKICLGLKIDNKITMRFFFIEIEKLMIHGYE